MRELISFDDIIIIPRLSDIESRDNIDISTYLNVGWSGKKIKLRLPIVSSPMDTVTESEMLYRMWVNGGIGILHRYCSIERQNQIVKETKSKVIEEYQTIPSDFIFGAAIGAVGDYIERAQMLIDEGVNLICIDVANGYNKNVVFATERLISQVNMSNIHLMVGNIGDGNAFKYLADTNMYNSIRCGIGSGAVCSTFVQTGCGYPTLQSIIDAKSKNISNVQICADGGIRHSGDIVKSLALGADFVMLGSMLAGTKASPGDRFLDKDGRESKQYRGMACYSKDTKILTKNGLKFFQELDYDDEIATLNKQTFNLEYYKPKNIFEYDYNGKMFLCEKKLINFCITPNHNLFVAKRTRKEYTKKFKLKKAEAVFGENLIFKKNCNWIGQNYDFFELKRTNKDSLFIPMNEWLDFFGFWIAEGCTYTFLQKQKYKSFVSSFSQKDELIIQHYCNLLNNWGIKTSYCRKKTGQYEASTYDKNLFNYLKQFGKSINKFIPEEIKNLSTDKLIILMNSIELGDGSSARKCIYTISNKLKDDLIEIILKIGKIPYACISNKKNSISAINGKKIIRKNNLFSISYKEKSKETFIKFDKNSKWIDYNDKVYCVEVENNVIYVERNGRMFWCGNSFDAQRSRGQVNPRVEGISTTIPYKGKIENILIDIKHGIQSGCSYNGAYSLEELRSDVQIAKLTNAAFIQGTPHILRGR